MKLFINIQLHKSAYQDSTAFRIEGVLGNPVAYMQISKQNRQYRQ